MNPSGKPVSGAELKIFDPRDASTGSDGVELVDSGIVQRNQRWWMYLAGQPRGFGATDIYSASLATGAALSATGWKLTRHPTGELAPVSGRQRSAAWDGNGGRHCPSYARGWDPAQGKWVERIYYAGAADNLWGPYTIGFLEWDGEKWIDQSEPAFAAKEDWEHGSVYEPNLIYHDGKWRMWYVAGSNRVRRYLRARLGRERGAIAGDWFVVVQSGTSIANAFRMEFAHANHDCRRSRVALRAVEAIFSV
ncbi:MAG: hypothetical protein ABSG65_35980 [Bryobacteraceae bacterium]